MFPGTSFLATSWVTLFLSHITMGGKRNPFALAESKTGICALSPSELTQKCCSPLTAMSLPKASGKNGKNTVITDKYLAWLVGEVVLS